MAPTLAVPLTVGTLVCFSAAGVTLKLPEGRSPPPRVMTLMLQSMRSRYEVEGSPTTRTVGAGPRSGPYGDVGQRPGSVVTRGA
ncbi:hypothetical protein ACFWIA_23430 [Streptomyces sp. NPDC127068]|uniref:hypothetical protein n=1 Tax=Streptomyces sp. NPDC127068 TaxID=3347127 RepID=UPI00364E96A0